jgi:uncharacterized membrane protein
LVVAAAYSTGDAGTAGDPAVVAPVVVVVVVV